MASSTLYTASPRIFSSTDSFVYLSTHYNAGTATSTVADPSPSSDGQTDNDDPPASVALTLSEVKTLTTSPLLPTGTIHSWDMQVLPPIIPTPSFTASTSVAALSLAVTTTGASIPSVQLVTVPAHVDNTSAPASAFGPERPNVDHKMTAPVDRFGFLNVAISTQGHGDSGFSSVVFSSLRHSVRSVSTTAKRFSSVFASKPENMPMHGDSASAVSVSVQTSNALAMSTMGFTANYSDAHHTDTLQRESDTVRPASDVLKCTPNPEEEEEEDEPGTRGHEATSPKANTENRQNRSGSEPAQHGTPYKSPEVRTPTLCSGASLRDLFSPAPTQDSSAFHQSDTTLNGASNSIARTRSSRNSSSGYGPTMTPFTSEGCHLESLPAQEEVVTMDARALSKYQQIQQPASPAIVFSLLEDDTGRLASPASDAPDGDLSFASASQVSPGRPDSLFSYVRANSISLDLTRGYTYSR